MCGKSLVGCADLASTVATAQALTGCGRALTASSISRLRAICAGLEVIVLPSVPRYIEMHILHATPASAQRTAIRFCSIDGVILRTRHIRLSHV